MLYLLVYVDDIILTGNNDTILRDFIIRLNKEFLITDLGTISYGLSFLHATSPTILGYSDADLARCIKMRRSTYGYSIFFGGNLVSWSAKKQHTVSRSSCESEYRALANTASKIV
nr:uncharacterized protein [Tanacetum cinerariifolium]